MKWKRLLGKALKYAAPLLLAAASEQVEKKLAKKSKPAREE